MRQAFLLLALWGCAHPVTITSIPRGAVVTVRGQRAGPAPVVVRVRPLGRRAFTARLAGYRPFEGKLPLSAWYRRNTQVEVLLIEEHGASGTWTPEDAP